MILVHDDNFLPLEKIERSCPLGETIAWMMHGQTRVLTTGLVDDARALAKAREELRSLGRTAEIPTAPLGFTRAQTIPLPPMASRPCRVGSTPPKQP